MRRDFVVRSRPGNVAFHGSLIAAACGWGAQLAAGRLVVRETTEATAGGRGRGGGSFGIGRPVALNVASTVESTFRERGHSIGHAGVLGSHVDSALRGLYQAHAPTKDKEARAGIIVGICVGVLVLLASCGFGAYNVYQRQQEKEERKAKDEEEQERKRLRAEAIAKMMLAQQEKEEEEERRRLAAEIAARNLDTEERIARAKQEAEEATQRAIEEQNRLAAAREAAQAAAEEDAKRREQERQAKKEERAAKKAAEEKAKQEDLERKRAAEEAARKAAEVPCAACGKPVEDGLIVEGETYHAACFRCSFCDTPIDGSYAIKDGKFLCSKCEEAQAPICFDCGRPVLGAKVTADGEVYHPDCCVCHRCRTKISGAYFKGEDGYLICKACDDAQYDSELPVCVGCGKKIEDKSIVVKGQCFHAKCFVCNTCRDPINGKYFRSKEGYACAKCHEDSPPDGRSPRT